MNVVNLQEFRQSKELEEAQIAHQFNLDSDEYGRTGPDLGAAFISGAFLLIIISVIVTTCYRI